MQINFKSYVALSKPGIVLSNLFVAIAGFFLASYSGVNIVDIFWFSISFSLILISSTSFNNYIDIDIDSNLSNRTKLRATHVNQLSKLQIIIFACITGAIGFALALIMFNLLTFLVSLFGFIIYVIIYSLWLKRTSVYSTLVGSLSGAVPPLVGYVAVSNAITLESLLMFLILIAWQMYHFFAIAIFRLNDYNNVNIPLLPIVKGIQVTKNHMTYWVLISIIITILLMLYSSLSYVYAVYLVLSIGFKLYAFIDFNIVHRDNEKEVTWAKKVFFVSILDIMGFSIAIIADSLLNIQN